MSYLESLKLETLVGRKINDAQVNEENDLVVLDTDKGLLFLSWSGDCCAHCFLANVSGIDSLIGATIISAEHTEWKDISTEKYDVLESMGTTLKTDKGVVTFETRLSHNGYYSGIIAISDQGPLGNYGNLLKEDFVLKPLKDF